MIGTLLKQLVKALGGYVKYHAERLFGRRVVHEGTGAAVFSPPPGKFDWQVLGDEHNQIDVGGPSPTTLDLLVHEPKFVLDVGCRAGDFALQLKHRFPVARV